MRQLCLALAIGVCAAIAWGQDADKPKSVEPIVPKSSVVKPAGEDVKKAAVEDAKKAAVKAAVQQAGVRIAVQAVAGNVAAAKVVAPGAADGEAPAGGVSLDTDPEIDRKLAKARSLVEEGRYRDAVDVFQHVLNESGGALTTQDERVYEPVNRAVERMIRALPPEGLGMYRLVVDSEARGLIDNSDITTRAAALDDVVRRFFMSSFGDDAALELASIRLDQHDFIDARRLLNKVLHDHPDPDVPRGQALARLAVAAARVGDREGALGALRDLDEVRSGAPDANQRQLVHSAVERFDFALTNHVAEGWPMDLGLPTRTGLMKPVPSDLLKGDSLWTPRWNQTFKLDNDKENRNNRAVYGIARTAESRPYLIGRWEHNEWRPTGAVVMGHGRIYFKTHDGVVCYDPEAGKSVWEVKEKPLDPKQQATYMSSYFGGMLTPTWPATTREVSLFGDRISKTMSLVDDMLMQVEGRWHSTGRNGAGVRIMVINGKVIRQALGSALRAVDAKTGDSRWQFPDENTDDAKLEGAKILAAATPIDNRLLVPVLTREGSLWLYALDRKGKALWATYLCADAAANSARWAPVGVTIDGSEAYVASGFGVVFAIDSADGAIRWATRYARESTRSNNQPFVNQQIVPDSAGFDDDTAIVRGGTLVVAPSDSPKVLGIDRATGQVKYEVDAPAMRVCMGVLDDGLFVAGAKEMRRYDVRNGEVVWKRGVDQSFGRAALTAQAIYLPVAQTIELLNPADGKTMQSVSVDTGQTDDGAVRFDVPVGNVYVDGERIVIVGMERVYGLTPVNARMNQLAALVEKGDANAMLERARLRRRMGQTDAALDDLRAAVGKSGEPAEQARTLLIDALLAIADTTAARADAVLSEAEKVAGDSPHAARVRVARAAYLSNRGQIADALTTYLSVAEEGPGKLVPYRFDELGPIETDASVAAMSGVQSLLAQHGQPAAAVMEARGRAALEKVKGAIDDQAWQTVSASKDALTKQRDDGAVALKPMEAKLEQTKTDQQALAKSVEELTSQVKETAAKLGDQAEEVIKLRGELEKMTTAEASASKGLAELTKLVADAQAKQKAIEAQLADVTTKFTAMDQARGESGNRLINIGRTYRGTDVGIEATLLAASRLRNEGQAERAELLLDALSSSVNPQHAAAATAARGELYESIGWKTMAARQWRTLGEEHADRIVAIDGKTARAGDVAKDRLAAISDEDKVDEQSARMPPPPWKMAWQVQSNQAARIDFGFDEKSPFLRRHMLLAGIDNANIVMREIKTGKDLWSLPLQSGGGSSRSGSTYQMYHGVLFPDGKLFRVGHVALLPSPGSLRAISLITGKQLWELDPSGEDKDINNAYNRWASTAYFYRTMGVNRVSMDADRIAYMVDDPGDAVSQVRVVDMISGRVRWERKFLKDPVIGLWVWGGYVNLLVEPNTLLVCNRDTGATVNRLRLDDQLELQSYYRKSPLVWTDMGVMYATSDGLVLRDLATSKELWRGKLTADGAPAVNQIAYSVYLYEHSERYATLYFYMRAQSPMYVIIDRQAGRLVGAFDAGAAGHSVSQIGLSADAKVAYLVGVDANKKYQITTIDVATRKVVSTMDLGEAAYARIADHGLSSGSEIIPVMRRDAQPTREGNKTMYLWGLDFYRKSDGSRIEGVKLPVPRDDGKIDNLASAVVGDNVFTLYSSEGVMTFIHDPDAAKNEPAKEPQKK